ncbi:ABC transporter permease [Jiangella alkaliphila]|uniref:Iron(III) transport system permease protein n=1 Tax=Jiangella alkaliphila TaxID=419479 RepID=A0A1H2LCX1_9ACTN|nr:ABC transporter permease subunit [Jiangella alkaliphila]SDU78585.1 iron(III) transport system permease protein [Jiangella alkaliphila]
MAAAAAIPLGYLVVRVAEAGADRAWQALWRERTWDLAVNSAVLVGLVSAGCLVLGVALAWLLTRAELPVPRLWWVLASLPLAMPSYVTAFAWLATWPGLHGLWPLTAVMVLSCLPYVTLPAMAAFRLADHGPADAARTLGRGAAGTFLTVTLPQVLPAALAGTLLAALYTLSDFGAPSLFRYEAYTYAIHAAYQGTFDRTLAAVMALVLAALALIVVVAERAVRRRAGRGGVAAVRTAAPAPPLHLGRAGTAVALLGLAALAAISLVFPLTALARRLVRAARVEVDWAELGESAFATVALSGAGALLTVALAMPIAYLAARHRGRSVAALEGVSYLGHALPGIVVGLSLVFFSLRVVPGLYQSAAVLCFAYAVLFLPKAIGATRAAVERTPPAAEEVARTLGRSALSTWSAVTMRHAAPGVAAAALLVAVTAMKELPATLLLRPTGVDTLATELWQRTAAGAYGAATPAALALVLVAAVPAWLLAGRLGARP